MGIKPLNQTKVYLMFVPMSAPMVLLASVYQKVSFLFSFLMLNVYLTAYLNNLDPFGGQWWFPTIDGPTHFPMHQYLPFLAPSHAKLVINGLLTILWVLQHGVMAKSYFKNFCYDTLGHKYAAFERSTFLFTTGVALVLIMMFWQKDAGVSYNLLEELPKTMALLPFLGFAMIMTGFTYFLWTLWEMLYHDIFGFNYMRQMRWDGFEFPFTESLKPLTRFNVTQRHPIYTCLFLFFGGALLTCPWSLGRLLQVGMMIAFTAVGTLTEEWDCCQFKFYNEWLQAIPNRWFPDFSRLSMSDQELNKLRKSCGQKID